MQLFNRFTSDKFESFSHYLRSASRLLISSPRVVAKKIVCPLEAIQPANNRKHLCLLRWHSQCWRRVWEGVAPSFFVSCLPKCELKTIAFSVLVIVCVILPGFTSVLKLL